MDEKISLFFKDGSSDKVYNIALVEDPNGWIVGFSYGRRGNSLTIGSKTIRPVPYSNAKKIYNKLVQEKTAKGYTEDKNGKIFSGAVVLESRDTGLRCQLLNEISEDEVEKYINDDNWCAQEKFDGRRRMLSKENGVEVVATNRKGLTIPINSEIKDWFEKFIPLIGNITLDGEDMGNKIMIFDDLSSNLDYEGRYKCLEPLFRHSKDNSNLKLVETAWTTSEKKILYKRLLKDNAEGIVFKKIDSLYKPGRPASGGDQLKFKFCASASCVVLSASGKKRSILVGVYDAKTGQLVPVGNVTVYPNQEIPGPNSIVEVKYLYYFPGGSLFQPVLLGIREDVSHEECVIDQLKIKREEVENE